MRPLEFNSLVIHHLCPIPVSSCSFQHSPPALNPIHSKLWSCNRVHSCSGYTALWHIFCIYVCAQVTTLNSNGELKNYLYCSSNSCIKLVAAVRITSCYYFIQLVRVRVVSCSWSWNSHSKNDILTRLETKTLLYQNQPSLRRLQLHPCM